MKISNATLHVGADSYLELTTDTGTAYMPPPKLSFLQLSFVVLFGPDVDSGAVPTEAAGIGPNPADGRWQGMTIQHTTSDPVAVALGRRFARGQLQAGTVVVPSFEEADREVIDSATN